MDKDEYITIYVHHKESKMFWIETYINDIKVTKNKPNEWHNFISNPNNLLTIFRDQIINMVKYHKKNSISLNYVINLYNNCQILLLRYSLNSNKKQFNPILNAFCICTLYKKSIHINLIMARDGYGNLFIKNIQNMAKRTKFNKKYLTLDSLPEPLGFYLKTGFKFVTKKEIKKLMPDRPNIKMKTTKKISPNLEALNRTTQIRWNKNTKPSAISAANELFKYLEPSVFDNLNNWDGFVKKLYNKNKIFTYDKNIIMYKKISGIKQCTTNKWCKTKGKGKIATKGKTLAKTKGKIATKAKGKVKNKKIKFLIK